MNIKKVKSYIYTQESSYVLGLIVGITLNLLLFSNQPRLLLILNFLLIFLYFVVSERKDKKVLLFTTIHFAIWGVILESFIIKNTNFTLKYKTKSELKFLNVPSWLFTIYILFVIASIYTYEMYKCLLN